MSDVSFDSISDIFDVLLAAHEGGLVLDEYEKTVFFNAAHKQIVKEYYLGASLSNTPFDSSEETKRHMSYYLRQKEITSSENPSDHIAKYTLPNDVWYIVSEHLKLSGKTYPVVAATQDTFDKVLQNPFKNTLSKRRAIRIEGATSDTNTTIRIAFNKGSNTENPTYECLYIVEPQEISLTDTTTFKIKIHSSLLENIIRRAIELAIQSRAGIQKSNV